MQKNKKHFIYEDKTAEEVKPDAATIKEREERLLESLDGKKEAKELKPITIQPSPNRILVEKMKEEIKSTIIIPEAVKKFTNKGVIVKLGVETPEKPQIYKVGQRVLFPATATVIPIEQDDRAFIILNQYDVYATEE